ncbi:hypothetical protein WH221_07000 [Chryseobacterium culicis]|uniref:Uncharacterized protein n=1 Tax=Chryseobacterium culicis TaxID=680127 RepID=A0A2S9CZU5_CHRCI|nr:hypothetical protein [Chryseobacterium culicis]PRB85986.1 hypothetical protein CQ022_06980 [Chryseobacterium culicis]PRB91739.1 hypothetical protein CQ033_00650 [Chryseobacterium culicis]
MKKDELTPRQELKTYFETGKHPTQGQFSELIDSLRHREDTLTNKEKAILANSLALIENAFIYYSTNIIGDLKFRVVVSSQDEEDQVVTVRQTENAVEKQFLLGSAPYTFKVKEILGETLKETEYYLLRYELSPSYTIFRMFGNELNTIPEGFDLGLLEGKRLPIQIYKQDYGRKVNVINTNIKFVNKTEVPIQYRVSGSNWGSRFRAEDSVTDHYDIADHLSFNYKADLTEVNRSIQCTIFDEDTNSLLATNYLYAGLNQDAWYGGDISEIRNVRIECNYSINEK